MVDFSILLKKKKQRLLILEERSELWTEKVTDKQMDDK